MITFFEGHLSFQNSPLWVDVNYLSAQYLKNHFMKHFPTLWLLLRKFLGASITFIGGHLMFSKLTTWGQCELFVCTISQEPLDEIFSYLVVASSEVSWDAHTGNTPQALTMAWSYPNVPLCGNLGEVEYQIPLRRLTWRWESWNRLLNHSLKEFKKSSHLLNSFYDPMPNTILYFFYNHCIVDKHFQCTAVQYTECWYTFKTEL